MLPRSPCSCRAAPTRTPSSPPRATPRPSSAPTSSSPTGSISRRACCSVLELPRPKAWPGSRLPTTSTCVTSRPRAEADADDHEAARTDPEADHEHADGARPAHLDRPAGYARRGPGARAASWPSWVSMSATAPKRAWWPSSRRSMPRSPRSSRVVPEEQRKLVTGHRSMGYFADRYGFEQIGTVIPSLSTSGEPTARELAAAHRATSGTTTCRPSSPRSARPSRWPRPWPMTAARAWSSSRRRSCPRTAPTEPHPRHGDDHRRMPSASSVGPVSGRHCLAGSAADMLGRRRRAAIAARPTPPGE